MKILQTEAITYFPWHDRLNSRSAVRAGHSPIIQTQTIARRAALAEREQQPRLRNSTSNRIRQDGHEALESPSSSNCGDLLGIVKKPGDSKGISIQRLNHIGSIWQTVA